MFLAFREIVRAKVRFTLLAGAIGLLVFLITFQQGLFGGLITGFVGAVENQNAEILVFNDQARRSVEGSFLFPQQATEIAGVPGVGATGPIGQNTFTVIVHPDGEPVDEDAVIFGYELGGLGEPTTLSDGRLPEGPGEAVASATDADAGFDIGDRVEVVADGADEVITVVGLADEIQWSVAPTLFVSFDTYAAARMAVNPDASVVLPSLVAVAPEPGVDAGTLTARIDAQVEGVEALTRQQAATDNPRVQGVSQSGSIILGLAFLVVTLVVAFFFLILTTQKTASLTLLRAVGAPARYLVWGILVQILVVTSAGIGFGVALSVVVEQVVQSVIPVDVQIGTVLVTVAALLVLALLGGLVSVRRVLRLDPLGATTAAGRSN